MPQPSHKNNIHRRDRKRFIRDYLGYITDFGSGNFRGSAEYGNTALPGREQTEDYFKERCLAAAVGSDNCKKISFPDFKIDFLDDGAAFSVTCCDPVKRYYIFHSGLNEPDRHSAT